MTTTGLSVAAIGSVVLAVRQVGFRNDYSITGQLISFGGVCALIGGLGMYRASADPKNCDS